MDLFSSDPCSFSLYRERERDVAFTPNERFTKNYPKYFLRMTKQSDSIQGSKNRELVQYKMITVQTQPTKG